MSNGTHTDMIAERLEEGYSPQEAFTEILKEFGYEQDEHNTPRIAGIVPREGDMGWLGVVRDDGMEVEEIELKEGQLQYLATYEHSSIRPEQRIVLERTDTTGIVEDLIQSAEMNRFEYPVTAVAGVATDEDFELRTHDHSPS